MLVTFKTYSGADVDVNSDAVQSIAAYQHYDHDMDVPDELCHTNKDGNREIRPDKQAAADALRISSRTVIVTANGSVVVQGDLARVRKMLGGK